jgi:prolyl-tRNA synthetase
LSIHSTDRYARGGRSVGGGRAAPGTALIFPGFIAYWGTFAYGPGVNIAHSPRTPMRLSRFFLPTLKETPTEAQIVSHRLMLRAGMIRQHAAGIYNWLPLGTRVLQNIMQVVREEQNAAGAQEIIMPTIQSGDLWRESGRYDDYGPEMLRIKDRHERDMLYGPTHEEVVTDIFRNNIKSYRDLPKNLYQIHWKFRDEVRPRFGVMRGREFLMKDAYSFDLDYAKSKHAYNRCSSPTCAPSPASD